MSIVKKEYKYHYFYQITNLINGHFYYGIHSTNDLEDGYMGSGKRLNRAYKKYGIENFEKVILKYFDTRKECAKYEAEIVTEELVHNPSCYNVSCGGEYFNTLGTISVKDKEGNYFRCDVNDPKYISGEYIGNTKGKRPVFDKELGYYVSIDTEIIKHNPTRYIDPSAGFIHCINIQTGESKRITCEEYKNNKDIWQSYTYNKICVKDKTGKHFLVDKEDPRYLSGELTFMWKDRKHKPKTIEKVKQIFKHINHQQGKKNSQYGTCWIHNEKENKKIKKEDLELYINDGWIKGRKMKF